MRLQGRGADSAPPVGPEPGGTSLTRLHPAVPADPQRVLPRAREDRRPHFYLISRERGAGVPLGNRSFLNPSHGVPAAGAG
ncbi:hypothetical protein MKK75_22670, partial [Methylobacterium sp. J-030]|uniref:hypothetical protein n=1 Tax=Methylobacterium sp. J-030 TaxID=2836627 RepID=UPI001FB9B833